MDVENTLNEKVVAYLKQLGLNSEQALAYLYLLQNGPQTVLALSRGLETGRTKLYPLLEDLAKRQLITIHERHYGTSYEAQPPEVVEFLVSEKEQEAEKMRGGLKSITTALQNLQMQSPTTSKIIEYRGVDGLKQMNWNLAKANGEFRVFELAHLSEHLGKHFAEKMRRIYAEKKLVSYDLTNTPSSDWNFNTEVLEYKKRAKVRYIDPAILNIEFETFIYNNCVTLLSYEDNDIFGVEIYNDKLAKQQTQLFDLVWSQASEIQ